MDLGEEKQQSDGEILEKGKTVIVIYNGDPVQSSLKKKRIIW